ncbi:hypothetical protein [Streptomyces sp. NBC_00385]|uniref:hypothetical protein n=1 Tax=Streptomyces sp. NBC_00385 TaxID=2975733 RepID=UPI002DDC3C7A|nr:hypothetical protein [Streptomyces sp. NBC_00385]WRZ05050.1 hypothetical protein OG959_17680 [Streptomyces sp. NBC_00385]
MEPLRPESAAWDDPVVMRARARIRHLVQPADQAYGTAEVRARVASWPAEHPDFAPGYDGPAREEWESAMDTRQDTP